MKEWQHHNEAVELLGKAGIDDATIGRLEEMGYFTAPASRRRHLAFRGGLARHSVNTTKRLVEITEKFGIEWPRTASPYLVGMLHDLVKCETYKDGQRPSRGDEPVPYEWQPPVYGGHGAASAIMAMADLGIRLYPAEAAAIVWHMGAFELDDHGLGEYHRALGEYGREILAAHTADMVASQLDEREA